MQADELDRQRFLRLLRGGPRARPGGKQLPRIQRPARRRCASCNRLFAVELLGGDFRTCPRCRRPWDGEAVQLIPHACGRRRGPAEPAIVQEAAA